MTKSQKIEKELEKIRKDAFSVSYEPKNSMDGGMYYCVDVYTDDDKARFLIPAGGTVQDIVRRTMEEVNNHTIIDQF